MFSFAFFFARSRAVVCVTTFFCAHDVCLCVCVFVRVCSFILIHLFARHVCMCVYVSKCVRARCECVHVFLRFFFCALARCGMCDYFFLRSRCVFVCVCVCACVFVYFNSFVCSSCVYVCECLLACVRACVRVCVYVSECARARVLYILFYTYSTVLNDDIT